MGVLMCGEEVMLSEDEEGTVLEVGERGRGQGVSSS